MDVLLIGEDAPRAADLAASMRDDGYVIHSVADGRSAVAALKLKSYDAVVLDTAALSECEMLEIAHSSNGSGSALLIGLIDEGQLVHGIADLKIQLEDFMVKPVNPRDLAIRINWQFRRRALAKNCIYGNLRIDFIENRAFNNEVMLDLPPRELDLLKILMTAPNRVFSRSDLMAFLKISESSPTSNAVDVHIYRLRTKIGHHRIFTVRGLGYKLA